MTGQSLLDRMELLNQELQLQSGETDVTRGLVALNVAQDHFESLAAVRRGLAGAGTGTVNTSASTESTALPSGLLRLDRLQLLDASTSRPKRELTRLSRVGGHAVHSTWPANLLATASSGEPTAYWTNGASIYWSPLPSGTYTVRWYGLTAASDLTAGGTFAYPDIVALPLAALAVRLMKMGLDDNAQDVQGLASEVFTDVLNTLDRFHRDGGTGLEYTQVHTE
jgi:hypothetical protein